VSDTKKLKSIDLCMPSKEQSWPKSDQEIERSEGTADDISQHELALYQKSRKWNWSGRRVYFFTDIHADTDAFLLSLEASGGIHRSGTSDTDYSLTTEGRQALFIIGGDCFDKGPQNLRLLEAIDDLYKKGADIKLLAGNHDIRTYLGIYYAERKEPSLDHLFARMGRKTVPFLKEIYDRFIKGSDETPDIVDDSYYEALLPSESWYQEFPKITKDRVKSEKFDKEMVRVREKAEDFLNKAKELGLDSRKVYLAVKKFKALFFEESGQYHWFFSRMTLAHVEGSYLFVHAGVDDVISKLLSEKGVDYLNQKFRATLQKDPFELYYGVIGNTFRTKYRVLDYDFSQLGQDYLHKTGIHAIVHGHKNILHGQRILLRQGMLNFECDASIDANTRIVEGLNSPGGAVVVFTPDGYVKGISTDYPYIKCFHPGKLIIDREGE
jgi:hypothetical protein